MITGSLLILGFCVMALDGLFAHHQAEQARQRRLDAAWWRWGRK